MFGTSRDSGVGVELGIQGCWLGRPARLSCDVSLFLSSAAGFTVSEIPGFRVSGFRAEGPVRLRCRVLSVFGWDVELEDSRLQPLGLEGFGLRVSVLCGFGAFGLFVQGSLAKPNRNP